MISCLLLICLPLNVLPKLQVIISCQHEVTNVLHLNLSCGSLWEDRPVQQLFPQRHPNHIVTRTGRPLGDHKCCFLADEFRRPDACCFCPSDKVASTQGYLLPLFLLVTGNAHKFTRCYACRIICMCRCSIFVAHAIKGLNPQTQSLFTIIMCLNIPFLIEVVSSGILLPICNI